MAEGWARALHGDDLVVGSAGTQPSTVNPLAISVMLESGVDISGHESQSIEQAIAMMGAESMVDLAVTVCDSAREACPTVPGARRVIHHAFDDPPALAADAATEEDALVHYRRVRDEIEAFVQRLPTILHTPGMK
jgi:arsenate reductase